MAIHARSASGVREGLSGLVRRMDLSERIGSLSEPPFDYPGVAELRVVPMSMGLKASGSTVNVEIRDVTRFTRRPLPGIYGKSTNGFQVTSDAATFPSNHNRDRDPWRRDIEVHR